MTLMEGCEVVDGEVSVRVTVSTWRARLWCRAMSLLRFVVGTDRAERWAIAGMWRLARWRIGTGQWRRFERT